MDNKISEKKISRLSIISLATGIFSIISVGFGFYFGIAAIICGVIDLKKGKSSPKSRRFDIAGIVTGTIGLIEIIIPVIFGLFALLFPFSQTINY
jgi:hypothetical protein